MPGTIIRDVAIERNQFVRTVYFTGTKSVQISTAEMLLGSKSPFVAITPLDSSAFPIYKSVYSPGSATLSIRLPSVWTGGCEATITKRY